MPFLASVILARVLVVAPMGAPEPAAAQRTVWAGHHVTLGSRRVPFRGKVQTRTDAFVVAQMRRDGNGRVEVRQRTCEVKFKPVGGVAVSMDGSALPVSTLRLTDDGSGKLRGQEVVQWDDEDVDRDGNPGMTVHVSAKVCSGDLYVANKSVTRAEARMYGGQLFGQAKVRVTQSILGAKGACLSVVASDTDERQRGSFAFKQVAANETCESLARGSWPVKVL